ncbi:MAG TPA: hypothetical protein VFQ45_07305, partial [Longimicrobium sp.]|nr:hypothetical protein [Longimicrobium sp.]
MTPSTPLELYNFVVETAARAERRGDWKGPGPISDNVQGHVLGFLGSLVRADGDISREEGDFLRGILRDYLGHVMEPQEIRALVLHHGDPAGRAGGGWVPDYFDVLLRADRERGTVNAANVVLCLRELGLQVIAADGRNAPAEAELLSRWLSPLEEAVARSGAHEPKAAPGGGAAPAQGQVAAPHPAPPAE